MTLYLRMCERTLQARGTQPAPQQHERGQWWLHEVVAEVSEACREEGSCFLEAAALWMSATCLECTGGNNKACVNKAGLASQHGVLRQLCSNRRPQHHPLITKPTARGGSGREGEEEERGKGRTAGVGRLLGGRTAVKWMSE